MSLDHYVYKRLADADAKLMQSLRNVVYDEPRTISRQQAISMLWEILALVALVAIVWSLLEW
jgi:hypothetical protein